MPPSATVFHPGVMHDHKPSGKWSAIQAKPDSPGADTSVIFACKNMSPANVVRAAKLGAFRGKPIALKHLDWYLTFGKGLDFVEDAYLEQMLKTDTGVQAKIAGALPAGRTSGRAAGSFKLEQADYTLEDFQFAFGAIDIFEFEADYDAGTLHAWFQDRYEWHPCYTGIYDSQAGDFARETNCVHAAMVEMKLAGAKDFWMKGEATVPLSVLPKPATGPRKVGPF